MISARGGCFPPWLVLLLSAGLGAVCLDCGLRIYLLVLRRRLMKLYDEQGVPLRERLIL